MNITRGLFRLWLVFATLFAIGIIALGFGDTKREFEKAFLDFSQAGTMLIPVRCGTARGAENADFTRDTSTASSPVCWYELPKFRKLYAEYKDMSDEKLSESLYARAGIALNPPRPWQMVGMFTSIALLPPIIVFILGWVLIWAFRGFRKGADVRP